MENKYVKTEKKAKQYGKKLAWSSVESCLFLYFKIQYVKVSTLLDSYACVQSSIASYKNTPLIASRLVPMLFYFFNSKILQIKQLFFFDIILQSFASPHSQELHQNNPFLFRISDTVQISLPSILKLTAYQRVTTTLINTKSAWFVIF